MSGCEQIRVGGTWLASIASVFGVGDLSYSHGVRGCEQASWSMSLDPSFTHPALVSGALVEVKVGSANIWQGVLDEPDGSGDGWTFTAAGLAAEGSDYLCLDASDNTTTKPDTAVDEAISRGLRWTRPDTLSSASFAASDDTAALNKVGDLLDAWALSVSKRWGVNADGQVYAQADPTTPSYHLTAGSGKVGLAEDEYASSLYGRFRTGASTYDKVIAEDGVAAAGHRRELAVDLTTLGYTNSTKAGNVLAGMLANGKARYAWTKPLTVSRYQLTTPGGTPAFLPFVKSGELVRLFGVIDEQGTPLPYLDFIIGRTQYEAGSDVITLSPVDLAARNLADVLALAVKS